MKRFIDEFIKKTAIYSFVSRLNFMPKIETSKLVKVPNMYIEIIGHSGIGKTTLFNEVKGLTLADWNFIGDIDSANLVKNDNQYDGSNHWELLVAKAKNLDNEKINGYQKIRLIKYFSEVVNRDFVMQNGNYNKGFLLEDGLCHNFSQELSELSEPKLNSLMTGRVIIYLLPKNSSIVVKRLRKREADGGHVVTHHIGLSDNQLKEIVETDLVYFDEFIKRAERIGVPVYKIYAEDDLFHNVNSVLNYEKQIVSHV